MPSRRGIRWNDNQVTMLKKAVSNYNRAVTRMIKSSDFDEVPNYVDFNKEKKRITKMGHRRFLYQRVKELGRILLKNNPKAFNPIVKNVDGEVLTIPQYLDSEIKNSRRVVNRRREELLKTISPNFEELSRPEQGSILAGKNLAPIDPNEEYFSGNDLDELTSEKYFSWVTYSENYMDVMDSMPEWSDVKARIQHIILELQDNKRALVEIFESKADEATIEYLYFSYRDHSKSFERRKQAVIRFWEDKARQYGID